MNPTATPDEKARVSLELARLGQLDREGYITCWRQTFCATPPKYLSLQFMRKALAHEAQVAAFGDLSPQTRRALAMVARGKNLDRSTPGRLHSGTRLLRDWNGKSHEVEVLEDGFRWKEQSYNSLSAIAREITGVRWSGAALLWANRKGPIQTK